MDEGNGKLKRTVELSGGKNEGILAYPVIPEIKMSREIREKIPYQLKIKNPMDK